MDNLEYILKKYGLSELQTKRYLYFYNIAIEKNIPYPHFYAITKLNV